MHELPVNCVDIPIRFFFSNAVDMYIFDNPEFADISVEATNFAFHWNCWKWYVEIPQPVQDRTIRITNWLQRIFGFASLRYLMMADHIDLQDTVWLSKYHADSLRRLFKASGKDMDYSVKLYRCRMLGLKLPTQ